MDLHIDSMTIRIAQQNGDKSERVPLVLQQSWPQIQRYDARQCPNRLKTANQTTFVELLAQPSNAKQGDDMENIGWNGKKVGVELELISSAVLQRKGGITNRAETQASKNLGEVGSWRSLRNEADETKSIDLRNGQSKYSISI
jgi:hypothetical protein